MTTLGFRYIIAYHHKNYIIFLNLQDKSDEAEKLSDKDVGELLNMLLIREQFPQKSLGLEGHKNIMNDFYGSHFPEREALENRGIYLSIESINKKPRLLLRYILNGDNTQTPNVIGFGKMFKDKNSEVLTFDDFMLGLMPEGFVSEEPLLNENRQIIEFDFLTDFIY
jgi:hypothetical protein